MDQKKWLLHYSSHFPTVEINRSFYRLPSRSVFETWRDQTPGGFVFSVKASRYITHLKKLKETGEALQRFFYAVEGLGEKVGPILFQFPPFWHADLGRLTRFLSSLPGAYRCAFEFRHASWLEDPVLELLRSYSIGLAIPDFPGMPRRMELTSNFVYIRFHGGQHGPGYTDGELSPWADRVAQWADQCEVFVYFNNDYAGWAVRNAATFWSKLKDIGLSQQLAPLKPL
jgi:uncharacterized protein YecE (DUF72 family)